MFKYLVPNDVGMGKEVFRLAYPVIVSNLSRVLMSVFDVAMVGRLGPAALAATGMGGMMFWGASQLNTWHTHSRTDRFIKTTRTES